MAVGSGSMRIATQPALHLVLRGGAVVSVIFVGVDRQQRGDQNGDNYNDRGSHDCTDFR